MVIVLTRDNSKEPAVLQLIIYGVNAVLVPEGFIDFTSTLYGYLEYVLKPGGAEVPASLILEAVEAGETDTVAAAFDEAVQAGYSQQLIAILKQVLKFCLQKMHTVGRLCQDAAGHHFEVLSLM